MARKKFDIRGFLTLLMFLAGYAGNAAAKDSSTFLRVYFDRMSSRLTVDSQWELYRIRASLKNECPAYIVVVGNASPEENESEDARYWLSRARADAVEKWLNDNWPDKDIQVFKAHTGTSYTRGMKAEPRLKQFAGVEFMPTPTDSKKCAE